MEEGFDIILDIISVVAMWLILFAYGGVLAPHFIESEDELGLLLFSLSRDGLFFCWAITIVKLIELMRSKWFNFFIRLFVVFVVYIVIYGIYAPPYMLSSFFQPFHRNVVAHFTIIFVAIEIILGRFLHQPQTDTK